MNDIVRKLLALCMLILFVYAGTGTFSKLDFTDIQTTGKGFGGFLASYFMQAILFFTSASALAFILFLKGYKKLQFVLILLITVSLYISEGFRYRIVVTSYTLMMIYHIVTQRKLNVALLSSVLLPMVILMGIMEIARNYGRGLDLTKIENVETKKMLDRSTSETAVFLASGLVVEKYDTYFDHSYLYFIYNAFAAPIPRSLWKGKPDDRYIREPILSLYGKKGTGQAFLSYCEYYISFGWFGVIFFPFITGLYLKFLWNWFLVYEDNIFAICLISIASAMMYLVISRGYLAGVFTLYVFAILPMWYLYKKNVG